MIGFANGIVVIKRLEVSESPGLELADHKAKAALIGNRENVEYVNFRVHHQKIRSKESLKYFGVMLDKKPALQDQQEGIADANTVFLNTPAGLYCPDSE